MPYIPNLIEQLSSQDWQTRKMAIDVIYTMTAMIPDVLLPFKAELVESLYNLKFDKYKQVREACLEAY